MFYKYLDIQNTCSIFVPVNNDKVMKTISHNVKAELKNLRPAYEVYDEIEELKTVRSCYNHFLCSHESTQMKVAEAQVQLNRAVVNRRLSELELELDEIKAATIENLRTPGTIRYVYDASLTEQMAIKAFNSDKRFTITE